MLEYPCIGCHTDSKECCLCEYVYNCFGGEQGTECHACPRYDTCCQEHINRAINKSDEDAEDRRLFR